MILVWLVLFLWTQNDFGILSRSWLLMDHLRSCASVYFVPCPEFVLFCWTMFFLFKFGFDGMCFFFFSLYFVWIGMKEVLVPFVFNFTSYELVWRKCLFFLCLTLLNMNWYEVFVLFLFNFTSSELVWSNYLFFFFFFFSLLFWIVENGKKKC